MLNNVGLLDSNKINSCRCTCSTFFCIVLFAYSVFNLLLRFLYRSALLDNLFSCKTFIYMSELLNINTSARQRLGLGSLPPSLSSSQCDGVENKSRVFSVLFLIIYSSYYLFIKIVSVYVVKVKDPYVFKGKSAYGSVYNTNIVL